MDPELIQTTKGLLDATTLEKREGVEDTEHDTTRWVEYWLDGELVHRSVAVHLKKWPEGLGAIVQDLEASCSEVRYSLEKEELDEDEM